MIQKWYDFPFHACSVNLLQTRKCIFFLSSSTEYKMTETCAQPLLFLFSSPWNYVFFYFKWLHYFSQPIEIWCRYVKEKLYNQLQKMSDQVVHDVLCSSPCNVVSSPINIHFHLLGLLYISSPQVRRMSYDILLNLPSSISLS